MARFALRNQKKIAESLGKDYLDLLLRSLKEHFSKTEVIEEHTYETLKQKVVHVQSVQKNTDTTFEFVIIGKTYDVYRLAYYSAMS
jgi:hypothetical protein